MSHPAEPVVTGPASSTPERIEHDPAALGMAVYPLLNACVVPRPIAWVSTISADGIPNLAPHSYFTVASVVPPIVQFTSVGVKDSLRNVRETGEFVVHVTTRALAEQANTTGTDFPGEISEFGPAGLTLEPSTLVAPPRIAESPVALECRVVGEQDFGGSVVIFGEVVRIAVSPSVADEDGRPDPVKLQPVSRMGADDWAGIGEIFVLRRVPYKEISQR